jgi:hypothetical protein
MAKGFSEASISPKKSSKSSSQMLAVDCEQIQQQLFEDFEELINPREKQGILHLVSPLRLVHSAIDDNRSIITDNSDFIFRISGGQSNILF